jgi:hypothetical protein
MFVMHEVCSVSNFMIHVCFVTPFSRSISEKKVFGLGEVVVDSPTPGT